MERPGILRILQWALAIVLLVGVILSWRFNQIGHNLINLTAVGVLVVGVDNLIIYYRCYLEKSSFETEGSFITFCFFILGIIFQAFNRSETSWLYVNDICYYLILTLLLLNASYYIGVILILIGYLFRQIYRLMTQTLLSASANIERQQLEMILNSRRPFHEIQRSKPGVNNTCSICLMEFEPDNQCILLPGCEHCFNAECIEEWLVTKSTCPYCRHNIRLDVI